MLLRSGFQMGAGKGYRGYTGYAPNKMPEVKGLQVSSLATPTPSARVTRDGEGDSDVTLETPSNPHGLGNAPLEKGDQDQQLSATVTPITRVTLEIHQPAQVEDDGSERQTSAAELHDVPEPFAEAFATIQVAPPADVPQRRWEMFVEDSRRFLNAWGKQAANLGWSITDLFALDPTKPMERYDRQGLLWMLKGEEVTALSSTEARLSGGLAYYRK
jgi:hypothetical protein